MRILAIRGQNLASLAGEFCIDFEAEPLAGAGIFAITGPTGAGKSTLLDALCLALYDEVPRISSVKQTARIGTEDGITASDRRLLLRHGTAEGKAEVDFLARDGFRYRATWAVRRARNRPDGKLQPSERTLLRLDTDENISGRKNETQGTIEAIIGLSFEQFTRGVLLAQGEFEAFIRAEPDKRAELLERLTGSGIYTQLGQRAWEKASAFRSKQDDIRRAIAGQNGLDDEQRVTAEADLSNAIQIESTASASQALLQDAHRWYARRHELADKVYAAQAAQQLAELELEHIRPRRVQLERDRKAYAFAAQWKEFTLALSAREKAVLQLVDEARSATVAEDVLNAAIIKEASAAAAQEKCAKAEQELAPSLNEARTLDSRIVETIRRRSIIEQDVAQNQLLLDEAENNYQTAYQAREDAEQELAQCIEWLDENAALAALVQREAELTEEVQNYLESCEKLSFITNNREGLEAGQVAALGVLEDAHTKLIDAEDMLAAATAALTELQAFAPSDGRLATLSAEQDNLSRINLQLREYAYATNNLATLQGDLQAAETKLAGFQIEIETAEAERLRLEHELPGLQRQQTEARRACALSEAAADEAAQVLRSGLNNGMPCPVCGATEHRLSSLDALLGEHLLENRARADAIDAEVTLREMRVVACDGDLRRLLEQDSDLKKEIADRNQRLAEQTSIFEIQADDLIKACVTAGLPASLADAAQSLANRQDQIRQDLTSLLALQDKTDNASKAEKEARSVADASRRDHAMARDVLKDTTRALEELDKDLATLRANRDTAELRIDRALNPAGDWKGNPDPLAWIHHRVSLWRDAEQRRIDVSANIPDLVQAEAERRSSRDIAVERARACAETLQSLIAVLASVQLERAALLGGKSVMEVEVKLAAERTAAAQDIANAREDRETASNLSSAAKARNADACSRQTETATAYESINTKLTEGLKASGINRDDVERVAIAGGAILQSEADAIAKFDGDLIEARAVCTKCLEDLAAHDEYGQPALSEERLAEALEIATAAVANATAVRNDASLKLRLDDQVRERTVQLREKLERELAASEIWLKLSDLIGDKEGKTFRRFAQGLTLDRLLEHANARLTELKPRYTLERGAGGDMLIQVVDNDMAGEVRGLHNLSGGERFLVSLALALGLAEMSTASGVRIESLFIDEGFGALDPASLGQAIALLEHLQASGRRVGVISHVEDLKERIPVKIEVTPTGRGTSAIEIVVS